MLKYLHLPLSRLDQEDSPVRTLLMRIKNVHIRNVCLHHHVLVDHSTVNLPACLSVRLPVLPKVVIDMTQKNPADRLSIRDYLDILTCTPSIDSTELGLRKMGSSAENGGVSSVVHPVLSGVPLFFDDVLYPLSVQLHWEGATADDKIAIICKVSLLLCIIRCSYTGA